LSQVLEIFWGLHLHCPVAASHKADCHMATGAEGQRSRGPWGPYVWNSEFCFGEAAMCFLSQNSFREHKKPRHWY
jgi:hypothetical protein